MPQIRASLALLTLLAAPGVLAAQTFKVEKFTIGGEGGTDYLTADPATGRVYISGLSCVNSYST